MSLIIIETLKLFIFLSMFMSCSQSQGIKKKTQRNFYQGRQLCVNFGSYKTYFVRLLVTLKYTILEYISCVCGLLAVNLGYPFY